MSRLTKRVIDEVLLCDAESSICKEVCKSMDEYDHPCDMCPINEAIKKLAHYEDIEEQGRMIELPCAVGDILYGSNEEFVIKEISYWEDDCDLYSLNIKIEDWKENFEIIDPEDIGKTVFRTKEEAEAKLAEMEGAE